MATTFKVVNGDISVSASSGRPNIIGNTIGENDPAKAAEKNRQDLYRCLSLETIKNGTTAGLQNMVGTVPKFGSSAISILVNRRIRSMFAAILTEQNKRPSIRPFSERFKLISLLRVFPANDNSKTNFRFRLGVKTVKGSTAEITGVVG